MQLIRMLRPKKRLLTRVFLTSLSIIALVGFGLAIMVNEQHVQNSYNKETAKLIAQIPNVAAELREHDLIPEDSTWLEENSIRKQYLIASCSIHYNQVWTSAKAVELGLFDTCERFNLIRNEAPPYYATLADQKNYFLYLLEVELGGHPYNLLVMKDAEQIEQEYNKFSRNTFIKLAIVLALALVLMILASIWGMQPLVKMQSELQRITEGKRRALSPQYPVELDGVTQAVNQLLEQSDAQQSRYQNAMNDLAHSLKTRLAAVHALMDDKNLERHQLMDEVMNQVGQMDLLVKYQLKRAMLGRQGLQHESTALLPILEQLAPMLNKVYQDKQVTYQQRVEADALFPGSKGDIMELLGNLMENAFRLCISQVRVTAKSVDEQLILWVEDDGEGVAPELRDKILERGVRADTRSAGQGIGLAVCNEIVASYNGRITIETSELEGAKFEIRIPIKSEKV
ncbi:ATP-binding protein [Paraferrimonas haliotis]|uniref:histidine kinase n=1 Tax=Paraferrimonas haliotis TaxID=2013866 RepID=A0AA37WYY4_9GAMM|nr:ATP-binding protein [Paraferrimonas haliotis]GLS84335.1 sensor histidine kinase [Paraferrimonas haliotis]